MVKPDNEDWERFGRASKTASPYIQEINTWRESPKSFDVASYYGQIQIHRAHTVMLAEENIITNEEAYKIITGIKKIEKQAETDPKLVTYMSTETALIKEIGEIGGKMHIGRSRNDLGHSQRRIFYRDQLNRLIGAVIDFRKKLTATASSHLDVVMPGYTHWRQAQPITLAHYIMAHVEAAGRTVERLEGIYGRTNLSPMGSAAFAGTARARAAGVVETIRPIRENMLKRLSEGFSTMTDLADTLVRLYEISFRQAHDIIVQVTLESLRNGILAENISSEMIEKASSEIVGKALKVPEESLQEALNPVLNVNRRNGLGMPAPESLRVMIRGQREEVNDEEIRHNTRLDQLTLARDKLVEAENML